jgi:hypothetical protein
MQTASKPNSQYDRQRAERPRRAKHRGDYFSLFGLVLFFAVYMYLVKQMQGITFDTGFLSLYCSALTVFIVRAFIFGIHPDYQE